MDNTIEIKSFQFAIRIVKLCKHIQDAKREFTLTKQLLRATEYLSEKEYASVIIDCKELEKLLTAIIRSTKFPEHSEIR